MYRNSMNPAMLACVNFYEHVCANYPTHNHILPHKYLSTPYMERQETVEKIVSSYIKNINSLWPKGFQKVRTFYELCMNEDKKRQVGYDTLEKELTSIGMKLLPPFHLKTGPRNDFSEILGKIHRFSVRSSTFLHAVTVRPLQVKMMMNMLLIGTTMPPLATSEGNNLKLAPEDEVFVTSRKRFVMSVINHLYDHYKYNLTEDLKREIEQRVDAVLELEMLLQQMRNSFRMENIQQSTRYLRPPQVKAIINTILEGCEIQIDFTKYLETLYTGYTGTSPDIPSIKTILDTEDFPLMVTLSDFEEFQKTYEILRSTPSSVFESFIWWKTVECILEDGPAELYQIHKGYRAMALTMTGPPASPPRNKFCIDEMRTYFGKFIAHVIAKKTNGRKNKENITEMFENVKSSYEESIQRTQWSDDETKQTTLAKIRKMTAFIGFDDSILESKTIDREYRKIDTQSKSYYDILAALYRENREKELIKLLTVNDFDIKPEQNPAYPNGAHFIREYNYVVVPITDIVFPSWDLGLEVLHYATVGVTLGHEMGHAIDGTGCSYNADGDMVHIMTDEAASAYDRVVGCFIEAYNKLFVYIPENGFLRVNGAVSVDENMADWQGFNMALMAYKKYSKKHKAEQKLPDDTLKKLTPEQLFSFAFSYQNCANTRIKHLVQSAMRYSHAPERARVNGVLKNSRQFSDAFGCDADSPMNPPDKCEIWF